VASLHTSVPGMPATSRSRGRRAALALVGTLGVGLGLGATPAPALAEEPTTSAQAAELVAARGHDLEVVTERFNEAREALGAQQAAADAAAAQLAAAQVAVDTARGQVVGIARSAYTGESMGSLQALMTSGTAEEFVNRVTLLQGIAGHQGELLGQAVSATEAATAAQATAGETAAEAQRQYDAVAAQQADLESQIADYQTDFARLSAEERRAALEAAAAAHAAEEARASRDEEREDTASPSGASTSSAAEEPAAEEPAAEEPAAAAAPASGVAGTVVATAMAQRGKPYVWAAAGPGSFDCSGLTQYAFRAAGISLPHSSRLQSQMGTAVSRADLQPGDLVFFYSPVSHVGIYIGNGQMVHAPTSGDVVKVAGIDVMGGYAGARRIG
jgi:peptidoglycan DL-endopeptidase CwlO